MDDAALQRMTEPQHRHRDEPDLRQALRAQKLLGAPPIPRDGRPAPRDAADSAMGKLRQHPAATASRIAAQLLADDIERLNCRQRTLFEKHMRRTLAIGIDHAVELMGAPSHGPHIIAAAVLTMQIPTAPLASARMVTNAVANQSPMRGAYVLSHAAIREEQPAKGMVLDASTVLNDMLTNYGQDAVEGAWLALQLSRPV